MSFQYISSKNACSRPSAVLKIVLKVALVFITFGAAMWNSDAVAFLYIAFYYFNSRTVIKDAPESVSLCLFAVKLLIFQLSNIVDFP